MCSTDERLVERAKEKGKLKKRLKILEMVARKKQETINFRGREARRNQKGGVISKHI